MPQSIEMANDPLEDLFDKPARPQRGGLDPQFQTQVDEILDSLKRRGLNARLSEGYRTPEKQNEYYAQGRTRPGPIITNARGASGRHTQGMAADIDLLDASGRPLANNDPAWKTIGEEAMRRGLGWGGAWSGLRDFRHVESRRRTTPAASRQQKSQTDPLSDLFDKESGQNLPPKPKSGVITRASASPEKSQAPSVPMRLKTRPQFGRPLSEAEKEIVRQGIAAAESRPRPAQQGMSVGELRQAEDTRKAAGVGELRRLDEPRVREVLERQRQPTAEETTLSRYGVPQQEIQRIRVAQDRAAAEDAAKATREAPELARLTDFYRQQIRSAQNRGIGPEKWLNEMAAKGVSGLMELGAGVIRTSGYNPLAVGATDTADKLALHARAMQEAAVAEGADRNVVSRTVQDAMAGFVSTAPELAAMSLGVPPIATFATGGAARAVGRGERAPKVLGAGLHGAATGAAFELPVPNRIAGTNLKLTRLGRAATKGAEVGGATTGIELATGAPPQQAVATGITNALFGAHGEFSRGGRRPAKETSRELRERLEREDEETHASFQAEIAAEQGQKPFLSQERTPQEAGRRYSALVGRMFYLNNRLSDALKLNLSKAEVASLESQATKTFRELRDVERFIVDQGYKVNPLGEVVRPDEPFPSTLRDRPESIGRPPKSEGGYLDLGALRGKERRGEVQGETQPDLTAQRKATQFDQAGEVPRSTVAEPTSEVRQMEPTPARFYHRDYGEVTESPNQRRVGKGRVRVIAEDGSSHVIRRADMTGRGNQRAVPIKAEEAQIATGEESAGAPPIRPIEAPAIQPQEVPESAQQRSAEDIIQPLETELKPAGRATTRPAETTAAGFKTDLTLSQFVRKRGGIVPSEQFRGELDRIRLRESGTTGLINQKARQGSVKQTADIMMEAANEAGFRDPKTGQPFENPGDFLYAVERDIAGEKIRVATGNEVDWDAEIRKYEAGQQDLVNDAEARVALLENEQSGAIYDRIVERKANESEFQQFRQHAKDAGLSDRGTEDLIASARTGSVEETPRIPSKTRPAEQLGFVPEGLEQQVAPPRQLSDQRGQLIEAEQARQEAANPERAAALRELEEIKRRGLTVDDYARQPDLSGNLPSPEKIRLLKELESGEQASGLDQPDMLERAGTSNFDEQIQERHGGFPLGRSLFGERPRIDTLGPKSINPEAEARMQAAEGIQPPSIVKRAKESLASVYHSFKRTFPEIDPNKDDVSAVVNDHLRQLLAAPNYAKALAFDKIAEITQNLGKQRLRVFSRNLILPDILKDIDAGLYTDKPLPFGYKSRAEVESDLAAFAKAAEETPAIKDALERRQGFTKALTEKLVSLELLPKEVLDDPRYYHRQVMEYVNNPAWTGTGSADVRLHRKGFQKGRTGGGDFNTRYQEAEFEWTAQALSLIARKEALARIQQAADMRPALDLEAKLWNEAHPDTPKTWQDFIPETHRIWQPVQGSHFYPTLSVSERTMDKIFSGAKEFEATDVRDVLALGGKRQQWVLPKEIAHTLDEFRPFRDAGPIDNVWAQAQSSWKQWVLLNPVRVLKYNLNNVSGDLDITLAYNPTILKQLPRTTRELWNYQVKGRGSPEVKAEIHDAIKRGVIDSGLTIVEIPDINKTGAFRGLTSPDPNIIQRAIQSYWGGVKTFTTWRENALRLAAYKHFQERIAKGEQVYGASSKSQIDAIKDPRDRAAKLARELVGDYGAVSHAGQWIRRHLIPFYSWIEINTPRYARLMRNLPNEGRTPTQAAITKIAIGAPKLAVKASVLYVAAQLWNRTMFPDEEKELRTTGRTPHLILGRNEDGSIRVLRVEGALADALEWFGAEDLPYDVGDVVSGKKGAGPKAKAAEAIKAPAERLVQSAEPFFKTIFETASGRTAYPSLFEKGENFRIRPRVIRDRWENVARVFSLDGLYRRVTGRPSPPSHGGLNYTVDSVLTYRIDPGEAAYWDARGKVIDWAKLRGKEFPAADPTERSNALYYYKQATKWHDEKAAKKWLAEYQRLGGTDKGMAQSLRMGHPLGMIKKADRDEFLSTLSEEERAALALAEQWYTKTYGEISTGTATPSIRRPSARRR